MRQVSPTVSFLTMDTLRRSMIPKASAQPQSTESTIVDKSSDFSWPPVGTRMDSLGLRNREIRKSRCTSESMLGPVGRDPASPTSCSPPFLNWKNTSKTDSDLNHDLIREVRSGA